MLRVIILMATVTEFQPWVSAFWQAGKRKHDKLHISLSKEEVCSCPKGG